MKRKKEFLQKKQLWKRMLGIMVTVIAILSLTGMSIEAQDNTSEEGSIVIEFSKNIAKDIEVLLYPIAYIEEDGELSYQKGFADSKISIEKIDWSHAREVRKLAEAFADYAEKEKIAGLIMTADASGKLYYEHLNPGLYVAVQKGENSKNTGVSMQAFLVQIPYYDVNGELLYQVQIEPKYEVVKVTPTPKPTATPKPSSTPTVNNPNHGGDVPAYSSNAKSGSVKTGDPGIWLPYAVLAVAAAGIGAIVVLLAERRNRK